MLKKNKSEQKVSRSVKNLVQCSVCNKSSVQTALRCESGHVICEVCQNSDETESRQDNGDFISGKRATQQVQKLKKNQSLNAYAQIKDLASGDHDKRNTKRKTKSECGIKATSGTNEVKKSSYDTKSNEEDTTTLKYKNSNFKDNSSSSVSIAPSKQNIDEVIALFDNKICPRPVTCPVQECNKMIALDSVMLHFYFDHSKVPRLALDSITTGQIALRASSLSMDTKCFAVFPLDSKKESKKKIDPSFLLNAPHADCKSVLLMGAKIPLAGFKISEKEIMAIRTIATQTELVDKRKSNVPLKQIDVRKSPNIDMFEPNEVLLLWLCKLDDSSKCYRLSVIKEDKKQGYNYTGPAIHIRHDQDSLSMYSNAECLIVHGAAANRLLDEQYQLPVIINVLE